MLELAQSDHYTGFGVNSEAEAQFQENVKPKQLCTNGSLSLPDDGPHASGHNETFTDTKADEEKFGSNISHLGCYSEIAEKSVENFASVISSFRFASSGSRASGLRAPLKDVQSTFTDRCCIYLRLMFKLSFSCYNECKKKYRFTWFNIDMLVTSTDRRITVLLSKNSFIILSKLDYGTPTYKPDLGILTY